MPLELPTANFANWKDIQAGYLYPEDCDQDNHVHVVGSKWKDVITVKSVSIKVDGKNTNLAPGSAITGFKYKTFPGISDDYLDALRNAEVIA